MALVVTPRWLPFRCAGQKQVNLKLWHYSSEEEHLKVKWELTRVLWNELGRDDITTCKVLKEERPSLEKTMASIDTILPATAYRLCRRNRESAGVAMDALQDLIATTS